MSKFKWMWIKIWGHYFKIVSPNNIKRYYQYHRGIYDIEEWNNYFKEV